MCAARYFGDHVYIRISDLQDTKAVFGADILYHDPCMRTYLSKYEAAKLRKTKTDQTETNTVMKAFARLIHNIETDLKTGIGFEMSKLRDEYRR